MAKEQQQASSQAASGGQAPAAAAAPARKQATSDPGGHIWGTGRRKTAVARVRIRRGSGTFEVNKRPSDDFFPSLRDRQAIIAPLEATQTVGSYDVRVNVNGGGPTGQADAIKLGLARALAKADPNLYEPLKHKGLLTRDPRMRERKKYGQPGARKQFQFSKR